MRGPRAASVFAVVLPVTANSFVHVELNTTDPAKAKSFYGQLFNWTMEDMPMGPEMVYTVIRPEESTGGGLMQHPIPGAPSTWLASGAPLGLWQAAQA